MNLMKRWAWLGVLASALLACHGLWAQPAGQATPATATSEAEREDQFWNDAKSSGNREAFDAYLDLYPKGHYAKLARAYQLRLSAPPAAPAPVVAAPTVSNGTSAAPAAGATPAVELAPDPKAVDPHFVAALKALRSTKRGDDVKFSDLARRFLEFDAESLKLLVKYENSMESLVYRSAYAMTMAPSGGFFSGSSWRYQIQKFADDEALAQCERGRANRPLLGPCVVFFRSRQWDAAALATILEGAQSHEFAAWKSGFLQRLRGEVQKL